MRFATLALAPLLASAVSASLASDALGWASDLVSSGAGAGGKAVAVAKDGEDIAHFMSSITSLSAAAITQRYSSHVLRCLVYSTGLASDIVQIKSLTVSPDPPVPGKNLTVNVEADVLDTIAEGAYADVTVKLGLIKLLQKQFDVCEEARDANATVQCPVLPGPYVVSQTVELPKEIPKAKFSVQVRGYSVDEEDLVCLNLFVDFMKK